MDKETLQEELDNVNDRISYINNNEDDVIQDKLNELQTHIDRTQPRDTQEGNISMNEHLQNVKSTVEDDPDGYINDILNKLQSRKTELEERINSLEE